MLAQALNTLRKGPDNWSWLPFNKLANRAMKVKCATALEVYLAGEAPTSEEEETIRAAIRKLAGKRTKVLRHLGQLLSEDQLETIYAQPHHAHLYVQALLGAYRDDEQISQKLSDGCEVARYWQIAVNLPLMEVPKDVNIGADIGREAMLQSILRRAHAEAKSGMQAIEQLQNKHLRFTHFELG